ncbi:MAG: potassium transporter inner membrane associated protein [Gammaproteobacteria bacterium]|nr:MAG: potassium transporter inner membrane associated protein [Gammaproteobacteria bacterium]
MKKILVFGGGQVGSSVAKILSDDGNDITLVDYDKDVLNKLKENIDIKTIHGLASYPSIQKMADAENCDMVIAVTGSDEVNMAACHVAKTVFNIPRRIARIRANEYLHETNGFDKKTFSINDVISPSILITDYVKNIIDHPGAFQAFKFASGKVHVIAATVLSNGPLSGKRLSEFQDHSPNLEVKVVAINRDGKVIIPDENTFIMPDDDVLFIATEDNMKFMSELRKMTDKPHNVMIAGGGRIGAALATKLESLYSLKVIEKNKNTAKLISEALSSAVVLNSDIADENMLRDESIEDVDYFCAVTSDDQVNILSAKLAKEMGASKTISIVNKSSYRNLVSKEIDIVVSPEDVTLSSLLAAARTSDIVSVNRIANYDGECMEIIAHGNDKTSKIVGKRISQLKLPSSIVVGAIVREDNVLLANYDLEIESDDHVIIFIFDRKEIPKIEKMFQVSVGFF